jgi:hypothetical protein
VRRSARGSAGKGGDHLLHCIANLARVAFRSADDRHAGAAEDELVRACVHDVENHLGVVAHVGVSARRAGPHAVGAVAVRPGSSVTSAVAPVGDGDEGGEFGGGGFGDVFSLKLSRTPPITGRGRAAFYRTLVLCRNANGRIGEREKGASEKRRDDVHEEDLHDGHAWKDHSLAKSAQR